MKFSDAIDKFLTLKTSEVSKNTIDYYNGKIPTMKKCLGHYETTEIDKFVIAEFTTAQRIRNPNISNLTLKYYRRLIVYILREVCDIYLVIKPLRVKQKVVSDLPDKIVERILEHLVTYKNKNKNYSHYYKYYFMIQLLLDTGVRINELVNIKVKNIDLSDRSILLDVTKNDKQRYVFFTEELVDVMLKYINRYKIEGMYLFPGAKNGNHITKRAVGKFLYTIKSRLGIDRSISPHKWRHTMATRYLAKEGTLFALQHILGHEEITTTQRYEHLNKKNLYDLYNKTMKNKV